MRDDRIWAHMSDQVTIIIFFLLKGLRIEIAIHFLSLTPPTKRTGYDVSM